jgi:hypothetical protein
MNIMMNDTVERSRGAIGCANNWHKLVVFAVCAALSGLSWAEPAHITTPDQSALETVQAEGWSFGVYLQSDKRGMQIQETDSLLEGEHVMARLGYKILPFLNAYLDAGWFQAQLGEDKGSGGASMAVGVSASLAEYVIDDSPVLGRKQTFAFLVSAQAEQSRSSLRDSGDLTWREYQIIPSVRYLKNMDDSGNWRPYQPTGVAMQGGIIFSRQDGDLDGGSIESKRNAGLGLFLGLDMRMAQGWIMTINGFFYSANDHTLSAGTCFYF